MEDTPDRDRLARIEQKLDDLLAAWEKWQPVLERAVSNPFARRKKVS
jgi:hypothetical protein